MVLLSGAVAAAYVALVALIGFLVSDVTTAASLAAAGAAALLLTPLREAAQRATNRVVAGSTRDPSAVVDALVAKLDAAVTSRRRRQRSSRRSRRPPVCHTSRSTRRHGLRRSRHRRRVAARPDPIVRNGESLGAVVVTTRSGAAISGLVRGR